MRRTINCIKPYKTIDGKCGYMIESWIVPEDFTEDEVKFFEELCYNDVLSPSEAVQAVVALRK